MSWHELSWHELMCGKDSVQAGLCCLRVRSQAVLPRCRHACILVPLSLAPLPAQTNISRGRLAAALFTSPSLLYAAALWTDALYLPLCC